MRRRIFDVNMLEGPISKNILLFALPLMATSILQILYNAADMAVLGKFVGTHALAAVGATSSTYHLIINVFIGLATGVGVLVAQQKGADDRTGLSETVHTSGVLSVIVGVIVCVLGIFVSPILLRLIGTPDDVLDDAVLYIRILFLGMPATTIYNFGAAILRSVGDNRRPFLYLAISGAVNVVLNLVFVVGFNMTVEGVGLATIISQYLSAALVWGYLMRTGECYYFHIKEARIVKSPLVNIIRIGVPSGIQAAFFSLANIIIQSAINSFGTDYIAGSTAANNVENVCYTSMAAMGQAVLVFAGQNVGAGQIKRLKSIYFKSLAVTLGVGIFVGGLAMLVAKDALTLFTSDSRVMDIGLERLVVIVPFYFLCGFHECATGAVRGTGYSLLPMLSALFGICIFRVIWIYSIFVLSPTFKTLMAVFPVSWIVTFVIQSIIFFVAYNRLRKKQITELE